MKTIPAKSDLDEVITGAVLKRAILAGQKRRLTGVHAKKIAYLVDTKSLMIEFADRSALLLPIKNYPEFSKRSEKVLCRLKLGAAGSAIYDDASDLHISIAGLVGASESLSSLAATVVASRNGQQTSQAKAIAARENGKKGGRPRTVVKPNLPVLTKLRYMA